MGATDQAGAAFALVPDDDWLHSLRADVVVGSEFQGETVNVADTEGFSDALLIGSALVASAHKVSLQRAGSSVWATPSDGYPTTLRTFASRSSGPAKKSA